MKYRFYIELTFYALHIYRIFRSVCLSWQACDGSSSDLLIWAWFYIVYNCRWIYGQCYGFVFVLIVILFLPIPSLFTASSHSNRCCWFAVGKIQNALHFVRHHTWDLFPRHWTSIRLLSLFVWIRAVTFWQFFPSPMLYVLHSTHVLYLLKIPNFWREAVWAQRGNI